MAGPGQDVDQPPLTDSFTKTVSTGEGSLSKAGAGEDTRRRVGGTGTPRCPVVLISQALLGASERKPEEPDA